MEPTLPWYLPGALKKRKGGRRARVRTKKQTSQRDAGQAKQAHKNKRASERTRGHGRGARQRRAGDAEDCAWRYQVLQCVACETFAKRPAGQSVHESEPAAGACLPATLRARAGGRRTE